MKTDEVTSIPHFNSLVFRGKFSRHISSIHKNDEYTMLKTFFKYMTEPNRKGKVITRGQNL